MFKIRRFLGIVIIFVLLLSLCTTCYAAVPVTDEILRQAFKEIENDSEGEVKVSINNNTVTMDVEDDIFSFNYELTEDITFTIAKNIKQGMTYEEFEKQNGELSAIAFGYVASAYTQGVEFEDSTSYFMMSILGNALNNTTMEEPYMIVDDLNYEREEDNDPKIIYTSEFGDRVMEYVNYTYKDTQVITDSDTYTWIVERTNVTETSCDLVSTLTVNLDGNFEEMKEAYNDIESSIDDAIKDIENSFNNMLEEIEKEENKLTPEQQAREAEKTVLREMEKQYRTEKNKIPNAGDTTMLVLKSITVVSIIALIVVIVCNKKMKK